jgi:hypothetical protein
MSRALGGGGRICNKLQRTQTHVVGFVNAGRSSIVNEHLHRGLSLVDDCKQEC